MLQLLFEEKECVNRVSGFNQSSDTSTVNNETVNSQLKIRYSKVRRAEVYLCKFDKALEFEHSGNQYVIVIQNSSFNKSSHTLVIPCVTQCISDLPVHHIFRFSPENMVNYSKARVSQKTYFALGEYITPVHKSRLIKYLGTMTEDFMNKNIQPIIDLSLNLKREVVYRDLNLVQIQLLSFVDINELISISKMSLETREKAHKILQLFGFDYKHDGVQYLLDAICISKKLEYFNLEKLSNKLFETGKYNIDAKEIQRLISARVKERFGFKESPTIDFIRLVKRFLV